MSKKAVFLDRDKTLIDDPGYISDSSVVKLLPGVELAIKSLKQAGYLLVVVTNQSGIARGLLTEETLETIHAEMRRQLGDKGAHLDAVYYCPYHPEGTVEEYAIESELRKPQPGMLVQAAEQLNIDLTQSWMVGDSPRDVEAGQRAGCRTIRIRTPGPEPTPQPAQADDEDVQADHTVRNLVEAARVILRAPAVAPPVRTGDMDTVDLQNPTQREMAEKPLSIPFAAPVATVQASGPDEALTDQQVRKEILRHVEKLTETSVSDHEQFSVAKLIAGVVMMLGVLALVMVVISALSTAQNALDRAQVWGLVAVALEVMALTLFMAQRPQ